MTPYPISVEVLRHPSGSYSATLDKFDRQLTLTDPIHGSSTFTWTYRVDAQPATLSAPNGNTTTYGYDAAGAPSSKATTKSAHWRWEREPWQIWDPLQ